MKLRIETRLITRLGATLTAALVLLMMAACADSRSGGTVTPSSPNNESTPTTAGTNDSSNGSTGMLDSMFGDGGKVITDISDRSSDEIRSIVVQPDGNIVALGGTYVFPQDRQRFALARYKTDGKLDTTFGEGGIVVMGMTDDEYDASVGQALALQFDGKLLVAGMTYSEAAQHNVFALTRLNADGTFDESFGEEGRVFTEIDGSESAVDDIAYAISLDSEGRIVLAGTTGAYPTDFALARYLPDGKLDTTFGEGGIVVTDLGGDDKATSLAIQPDGKIIAAGYGDNEGDDWAITRYLPDGKVDTAFGEDGIISLDFKGGEDRIHGIALRPDGKILVAGTAYVGVILCVDSNGFTKGCDNYSFVLAQYNEDGSPDTSFGTNGTALFEYELESGGYALALQSDGKAVLAGHYDDDDFAAIRVKTDGTLDNSFGVNGLVRTPFGRSYDVAYALALQPDGKIVLAGTGVIGDENPLNGNFALVRYGK